MLVSRYADNDTIDFDNFTCCLVKLEAMFSTYSPDYNTAVMLLVSESFVLHLDLLDLCL